MTRSEERNDELVLDLLGFGTGPTLEPAAAPAVTANPMAAVGAEHVPMTRREARRQERTAEAPAARRGAATGPGRSRTPRRAPRVRRDVVRTATAKPKVTIGKRLLQVAAMLFAGALAFGMTVPANAFDWGTDAPLEQTLALASQSLDVDPTLVSFAERDTWAVTSWAEMLRLRYGNRDFDYSPGMGDIRWPFPTAVPISSGFGDRAAPCRGCSTQHSGIDFNPGWGAAIFAIADGVVYEHGESGSSWGNYVVIKHQIDGQTVFSGYAHMQSGSSPMKVGQEVVVGDFVGLVGATGQATGAHLHFTIAIGDPMHFVDPFTFLKRYAS